MTTLYHYTCDHGRTAIGDVGVLRPLSMVRHDLDWTDLMPAQFVWLTDLPVPDREGLGLTSNTLQCDRTTNRYRVIQRTHAHAVPWADVRDTVPRYQVAELERAPGAKPEHWWVSRSVLAAVYEPGEKP